MSYLHQPPLGPLPRHRHWARKDQLQASYPPHSARRPHTLRFATLSHSAQAYRAAGWRGGVWGGRVWSRSGPCGRRGVSPGWVSAAEQNVSPASSPLKKTQADVRPSEGWGGGSTALARINFMPRSYVTLGNSFSNEVSVKKPHLRRRFYLLLWLPDVPPCMVFSITSCLYLFHLPAFQAQLPISFHF